MYCVQSRIYCNDCTDSHIDANYTNHLRPQCHINNVRKKPLYATQNQFIDSKNTFYQKLKENRTF